MPKMLPQKTVPNCAWKRRECSRLFCRKPSEWPTTGIPGSPITGFRPVPGGGSASACAPGVGSLSTSAAAPVRTRMASGVPILTPNGDRTDPPL